MEKFLRSYCAEHHYTTDIYVPDTRIPLDSFPVPAALIELSINSCLTSPAVTLKTSFRPEAGAEIVTITITKICRFQFIKEFFYI